VTAALAKPVPVNSNATTAPTTARSRDFLERQAFEAFKAFVMAFQDLVSCGGAPAAGLAEPSEGDPTSDVLTADEAAAFLGVDRNTVYEYAGRGVIPHQRLGKRLIFRRGALVAWLDSSLCKATSTRKG
jgi:excisionase family DNA binding protein